MGGKRVGISQRRKDGFWKDCLVEGGPGRRLGARPHTHYPWFRSEGIIAGPGGSLFQ